MLNQKNIVLMNEILENRKKVNKEKIKLYTDCWLDTANDTGLSKVVVKYFCEGYVFIGPQPIKTLLDRNYARKNFILDELYDSNEFLKSKDVSFRIACGLLSVFLNDYASYENEIKSILMRFKWYSRNKEDVQVKTAPASIQKYLLGNLNISATYKPIEGLELSIPLINEVYKLLVDGLSQIGKLTNKELQASQKILKWLKPSINNAIVTENNSLPSNTERHSSVSPITKIDNTKDTAQFVNDTSTDFNSSSVNKPKSELCNKQPDSSNKIVKDEEIESLKKELSALNHDKRLLENQVEDYKNNLSTAMADITNLNSELEKCKYELQSVLKENTSSQQEIKRLNELLKVIDQQANSKMKLFMVTLSNNLKPYYMDYKEIINQKPTAETAQIAFDILRDIFATIESNKNKFMGE